MLGTIDLANKPGRIRALVLDQRSLTTLIREIIDESGYTVAEVAQKLGVKSSSVRQYYMGYRSNPGVNWMIRLAAICGAKLQVELP